MSWERWEKKASTTVLKILKGKSYNFNFKRFFFAIATQNKTKAVWKSLLQFNVTEGFVQRVRTKNAILGQPWITIKLTFEYITSFVRCSNILYVGYVWNIEIQYNKGIKLSTYLDYW